jgi:hypothetical protein
VVGDTAAGAAVEAPLPRLVWINFLLVAVLWLGAALWTWWFTDLELRSLVGAAGGLGLLLLPLWLLDKLPSLAKGVESALRRVLGRLRHRPYPATPPFDAIRVEHARWREGTQDVVVSPDHLERLDELELQRVFLEEFDPRGLTLDPSPGGVGPIVAGGGAP